MFKTFVHIIVLTYSLLIPISGHASDNVLPDFSNYTSSANKKKAFFKYLYPIVQQANRDILKERIQVTNEYQAFLQARPVDMTLLSVLAQKYKLPHPTKKNLDRAFFKKMLFRIDVIPPSLAMAQAANESAWGTSRFAVEGNNLYGQWCYKKGCGLVPDRRKQDARHEVAKFKSPQHSVRSYMRNLNTQMAYRTFRLKRQYLRDKNAVISGTEMADTLLNYSTRREAYIIEIKTLIRRNKLAKYDQRFHRLLLSRR